jgi:rhamnogalacturonan acetylesterase
MQNRYFKIILVITLAVASSFVLMKKDKPVFYIIGDSTVKNGNGGENNLLMGWGNFIAPYFDTNQISVVNNAIGGRSSRTFLTEGRWDNILATLKKGDYVIMQFGHNDSGPLDDTARARGTLKGTGEETKEIDNPITHKHEVVHSYGWYMRKYIQDTRSKGAIPIVCSPIPRNDWKDGKVLRSTESYAKWAKEVAVAEGACFIDLNDLVATKYEALGAEKVKTFFPADHTHTNREGAEINAAIIIEKLRELKPGNLVRYMK